MTGKGKKKQAKGFEKQKSVQEGLKETETLRRAIGGHTLRTKRVTALLKGLCGSFPYPLIRVGLKKPRGGGGGLSHMYTKKPSDQEGVHILKLNSFEKEPERCRKWGGRREEADDRILGGSGDLTQQAESKGRSEETKPKKTREK